MGTWDYDLHGTDMAEDVREAYSEALDAGLSPDMAESQVRGYFTAALADPDDGPVVNGVLESLRAARG